MTVSMYSVSIPVFIQHLNGLNTVLDKAASWAVARKVAEADLLNMRLSHDMFGSSWSSAPIGWEMPQTARSAESFPAHARLECG